MRKALFASVALTGALASFTAHAAERVLTVAEAERIAIESNPRLQASEARVRSAQNMARTGPGHMLPVIKVSDEYQHYDKEFGIAFGSSTFVARDADTNTFTASADQPLLGLLRALQERQGAFANAYATGAQRDTDRATVKQLVEMGYLRLFEARALEDVARASQTELADEMTVAEAQLKAGVLTNADLLRLKVARANARQQEILAHTQAEVARADLLGVIGLPLDDASVEFAEPRELLTRASSPRPSARQAQERAIEKRPELMKLKLLGEAADRKQRALWYALLPDLNAEAAYTRVDGQVFAPKNSAYVGLKLNWAVWEWGTSFYTQKAAEETADAARFDLDAERRAVGVEVSTHLAQAEASNAAVDVARQTIESAQEAYRVTEALLKAGSATTTDLLDAEAALTQARLNLTRAEYEQAMARVALEHSMGE